MEVSEGGVTLQVPAVATDGKNDEVFFNPHQELNRDLTVAVLQTLDPSRFEEGTYLDGMTASGIRAVRAGRAGWNVTACDRDPRAVELAERNLEANGIDGEVCHRDVNALCHERAFDVVDLDPFGSPMPFASAGFAGAREVLCVTATDTAPLCGAHFAAGRRRYGAIPRNTEYHPEMGLRILVGALSRTAAVRDVGAIPICSHVERHYARTYLRLTQRASAADEALEQVGSLWHCPECLARGSEQGLLVERRASCPNCEGTEVLTAGPLWVGCLHDRSFLRKVKTNLEATMGTKDRIDGLCERLLEELDEPTHFDQHRLCKRWGRSATAMSTFLDAIRAGGYEASRTHYGGTTFKTTAPVGEIRRLTG